MMHPNKATRAAIRFVGPFLEASYWRIVLTDAVNQTGRCIQYIAYKLKAKALFDQHRLQFITDHFNRELRSYLQELHMSTEPED
jgi:hypothetical protein